MPNSTKRRDSYSPRRDKNRSRSRETKRSKVTKVDSYGKEGRPSQTHERNERVPLEDKEKPNFHSSGILHKELTTFNGIKLKYAEPPEARKPNTKWRLYVFKDKEQVDLIYISKQSCYLIGKETKVCDIPLKHPTISSQHCCIQYRLVNDEIKLYLIDLNSSNGTFVNKEKIPTQRYFELKNADVIMFGFSKREYVLMQE